MRFISWSSQAEEMAGMPPKAFLDAMDHLVQEAGKAGCVMVEANWACTRPRRALACDCRKARCR